MKPNSPKDINLLIIDDNEDIIDLLKFYLHDDVHNIFAVTDGLSAKEALTSHLFDVIISDYHMPKLTGLEILAWMRLQNIATPFILLTGEMNQSMVTKANKLGAAAVIGKTFLGSHINETVKKCLRTNSPLI